MTEETDPAEKLGRIIGAGQEASVEGVMAICARLAIKGLFDRSDIDKVLSLMTEAAGDVAPHIIARIDSRREALHRLADNAVIAQPPHHQDTKA